VSGAPGNSLGAFLGTDLLTINIDKHPRHVCEIQRVIPHKRVEVQLLRIEHFLFLDVDRVGGHEAAQGGSVEAGPKLSRPDSKSRSWPVELAA